MVRSTAATDGVLSLGEYEELAADDLYRVELSAGWLVHEPAPGPQHGRIQTRIARLLDEHVERHDGGAEAGVVLSNTGFVLFRDPPTVRIPDVAFLGLARIPPDAFSEGLCHAAPDLVVEINSPSNTASDNQRKVTEYLDAGVRLVWIVDPPTRTVTVYGSRSDIRLLRADAELDGGDVLPTLRVTVERLLGMPPG